MPPTVPETREAMIQFFTTVRGPWEANAAQLNFTPGDLAEFTALLEETLEAQDRAFAARNAARAAMFTLNLRAEALHRKGAALISVVRATAARTGDDSVYAAGSVPLPAARPPRPAPRPPHNVRASMDASGATILTWDASTAGGVSFTVARQLAGEAEPRLIGSTGDKRFIDRTVPLGTPQARYLVTARRGRKESWMAGSTSIQYGARPPQRQTSAKAA